MGVQNLWKVLENGNAVTKLRGDTQFNLIAAAVENKVVAIDLSAWLMQAQTQPAMLAHYDSDYARAVKIVFDRTIHWLRHGCLPVFVIEGQTPQAKLDKLRQRCIQQYGPHRRYDVGNRAGGQFDRLGQAVKRLLGAFGVPCVQAVGEGEAMCAALNICGWAHACHTLDVDALLFGAITVYRQMHLSTDRAKEAELTICRREDVQRVLGISSGGDAALTAVAQLAGGDYDLTGVENVGQVQALAAVRYLLKGCESDDTVLQKLEAALAAGPNPELDALLHCTGCKACGHDSGTKSKIKQHPAKRGCAICGCDSGCIPRDYEECECAFHRLADERLLNRVVRLAAQTPGFINKCRIAAATYQEQMRLSITAVQREYGLAEPGSTHNVFRWQHRPDARAISELMCKYIKDWDYHQVRLKLLPLLLEWDVRQGPQPPPTSGVEFRPTAIRQVSSRGAEEAKDVPKHQQQGWRYILNVERLAITRQQQQQGEPSSSVEAAAADVQQPSDTWAAEDLAIDQAWLDGTARSKPKPQTAPGFSLSDDISGHAAAAAAAEYDDYHYSQDLLGATQASQQPGHGASQQQQGFDSYTEGMSSSQAAAGGSSEAAVGGGSGAGGRSSLKASGSLQFAEHRSVRCSLVDQVWPQLANTFRNPPAIGSRAGKRSNTSKKKQAAAESDTQQRSLKDFFATTKDPYAAAKPLGKLDGHTSSAQQGLVIPGLAGITAHGTSSSNAEPQAVLGKHLSWKTAAAAELAGGVALGGSAAGDGRCPSSNTEQQQLGKAKSFMDWLDTQLPSAGRDASSLQAELLLLQQSVRNTEHKPLAEAVCSQAALRGPGVADLAAAAAAAEKGAARSTDNQAFGSSMSAETFRSKASGNTHKKQSTATSASARRGTRNGRQGKHTAVMQAGALDPFIQKPHLQQQQQVQLAMKKLPKVVEDQPQQMIQDSLVDPCDSPEVLPLAARLARGRAAAVIAAAATVGESSDDYQQLTVDQISRQVGGAHGQEAAAVQSESWQAVFEQSPMPPPSKKASTDREKEKLSSPCSSPQKLSLEVAQTSDYPRTSRQQPHLEAERKDACPFNNDKRHTHLSAQFQALIDDVETWPDLQGVAALGTQATSILSQRPETTENTAAGKLGEQQQGLQQQQQVINLTSSPEPATAVASRSAVKGRRKPQSAATYKTVAAEVVDLT